MTDNDATADSCPMIDEFVGQGAPVGRESRQPEQTASIGCAILTEFIDQGKPAHDGPASVDPADSPRSTSQGCDAITTFSVAGFIPAGAEKNGGVSQEQATAKRESGAD
jgi:hypothetical protein